MPTNDRQATLLAEILGRTADKWAHAWQIRKTYHPSTIRFDRPINTVPISLTGTACALNCAHCGRHYLRHMHPIWDPRADGAPSLLISGGCDRQGRVPITSHLEQVAALRQGRRLNWHVGFTDEQDLLKILPYVDAISFDIIGDAETAREVYGLDVSLDDYLRTFDMLRQHVDKVIPHLTIGLRGGRISGERAVLHALQTRDIERLILLILIPTPGTAFANCSPPSPEEVADLFLDARIMLPKTSLYLGCMRPHGQYRHLVDELAIRAGLNAIVNPAHNAQRVAKELGLKIIWGEECCALD
ncbi:MAG: radical SAM protein [Anaerolineae bacterium]|nr:radical SAM protein [Anaerolineae bacterium]